MLTPDQQRLRAGKLTASRIACLMTGDAAAVLQLYHEMIGEAEPEDLSGVWPVRLGEATEALNLEWFERAGFTLSNIGQVAIHLELPWAAATLDAFCVELQCPVECKHTGGREPLEVIIERYQPQMQWQMACTGATQCALSVIMGASPPVIEYIPRDEDYIAEMISRGTQFMDFIERRVPPVVLDPVPPPTDASKIYDMSDNPQWSKWAGVWIQTFGAAWSAKEAEKVLKSLVVEDSKKSFGCGIQITRDRAGRLSLRVQS